MSNDDLVDSTVMALLRFQVDSRLPTDEWDDEPHIIDVSISSILRVRPPPRRGRCLPTRR